MCFVPHLHLLPIPSLNRDPSLCIGAGDLGARPPPGKKEPGDRAGLCELGHLRVHWHLRHLPETPPRV